MAVNPYKMVLLKDGGVPSTFDGACQATVSGGQFVYPGSQTAPVSSGADSFTTADIQILPNPSGTNFPVGLALIDATSGTTSLTTVVNKGLIIAQADGTIEAGQFVGNVNGAHALSAVTSGSDPIVLMNRVCGRALSTAGSTEFVIARIDL